MSYIQRWDVDKIIRDIGLCHAQAASSYNDGFTSWPCKQDLYRVKFALEEMLKNTPTFAGEQEWLEQQQLERDQKQVWRALNQTERN